MEIIMETYKKVKDFIDSLHNFIEKNVNLFGYETEKEEKIVFNEIFVPCICEYLKNQGFDVNESFNPEGGYPIKATVKIFNALQYPDAIIWKPYIIAIEYKQNVSGALIKQCIGQSLMHWIADEYDFIYYLFWDRTKDKVVKNSLNNPKEKFLVDALWFQYRTVLKVL